MRLAVLLLPCLLSGCADRASQRERDLEARVTRLEAQVRELSAALKRAQEPADTENVAVLAGARTCALDLARALEAYRTDNDRYPPPDLVGLPASCADFRVDWRKIAANAYAFGVQTQGGQNLTEQQGP